MAGLTKEQKAARAASAQDTPDPFLVNMTKDGESLAVHPSCVDSHKSAGWTIEEE